MAISVLVRTIIGVVTSMAVTGAVVGPIVAYSRSRQSFEPVRSEAQQVSVTTEGGGVQGAWHNNNSESFFWGSGAGVE